MPDETTTHACTCRRLEDIALDLLKFIAITTGYGKPATGAGFQAKVEKSGGDYAESLLQLYERCRGAVGKGVAQD